MTPVLQEFLLADQPNGQRGDCLRAAVASMLDLSLSEVPHFVQIDTDGGENWWQHLNRWLHDRALALFALDPDSPEQAPRSGEYYLASGPAVHGGYLAPGIIRRLHVVVYQDEQLAHDPHPDTGGIGEVIERWAIRPVPILA